MVAIVLSALTLCANASDVNTPPSANGGVRSDYAETSNVFALLGNLYKYSSGSLTGEDKKKHTQTVIFAAANLDTGSVTEWYNPDTNTGGRIYIVMTKPVQGGFCRLLFTQVEKDGNIRDYSEYACKTMDSRFWTFYLARE